MDPISSSSQSNQNLDNNKLNSQPGNAFKTSNGINFNVKVPPEGILDSPKAVLNSNNEFRQDKNIKIDLGLNSVPDPGYAGKPDFLPKPDLQPKQSNQNNSLLTQAQGGNKNSDHFKLSNSEVQGPKPPLVPKNSNKIVFAVIVIIALGALAAGGYYLMQKNNDTPAVITPTPSPEPVIDPALDTDSDTIPDVVESAIGTSSSKADTDDDGFSDLSEIKNGYSPLVSGGEGKYTPEELQILMDKIRAADQEFYEKEFGSLTNIGSTDPVSLNSEIIAEAQNKPQSNIDNCNDIINSSFKSVNQYSVGLGPNGALKGNWSISFQDGKFSWFYMDVVEKGTYACSNNILQAESSRRAITAYYDWSKEILTWDGIEYYKVK